MSIRGGQLPNETGSVPGNGASSPSASPIQFTFADFTTFFRRHQIVIVLPIVLAQIAALYSYFYLTTYTSSASLLVQKAENSSLQALSAGLGAGGLAGLTNSSTKDTYLDTILMYLRSGDFYNYAAEEMLEKPDGKILASSMANKVPTFQYYWNRLLGRKDTVKKIETVTAQKLSGMLASVTKFDKNLSYGFHISVTTSDQKLSVKLAEIISDSAIKMVTRRDLKQLEEGKSYVVAKLDEISLAMREIEKEMLSIRKNSDFSISPNSMRGSNVQPSALKAELEENGIKLDQNERLIASLSKGIQNQQKTAEGGDPAIFAILSRQVLALEARRQGLISEGISDQSSQISELDEELSSTREQLKAMKPQLGLRMDESGEFLRDNTNPELRISALKKENWVLKARMNAARKILSAYKVANQSIPQDEQKYLALTKRLEMRYLLFAELSKNLFHMDVSRISIQNRLVMLERPAINRTARKPTLVPTLPLAFIMSTIVALCLAFALEKNDPVISFRKDLPGFNYVFLGSIPQLQDNVRSKTAKENFLRSVLLRHKLDLPQTIPFKRLRTRILHLTRTVNEKAKIISLSSSHSGDGKSFVTANLAASMAATGKKVLLVDTDLRKKALSKEFSAKHNIGISAFLSDPSANSFDKHIIPKIQENLDFFPSGPSTNNSTELVNTPKFGKLLNDLRLKYDFIFIDNPPFMALPDSEIVAGHSDIVIINVSARKTKRHDTQTMLEHFLQDGDKIICVILNRSSEKAPLYYGAALENTRGAAA